MCKEMEIYCWMSLNVKLCVKYFIVEYLALREDLRELFSISTRGSAGGIFCF